VSKALVLMAPRKGVLELIEENVPDPAPDQIQIRVSRSLISAGTERAWILARENMERPFPFSPGYSTAGVVEKVGKDVTRFKVGDRVTSHMTHRSLGNISQDSLTTVMPDNVSFEQGTFVSLGAVGFQGTRKARIELGESVVVLGLGLVGQFSLQAAHLNGAVPLIGVDRVAGRLSIALAGGANVALDNSKPDWRDALKEATNGRGPAVVIEATGFPDVITTALEIVGQYGRVVLNGSTQGLSTVNFFRDVHCKQVSVIGALNPGNPEKESRPGHWTRRDEIACFLRFLADGRINTDSLISRRVGTADILSTFTSILEWKFDTLGTIIEWDR